MTNTETADVVETIESDQTLATPGAESVAIGLDETGGESNENSAIDPMVGKARKEAANYRERLRKAETERDTANDTIETLRRQIIDGQTEALGIKPAALWAAGYNVGDFLTETGAINPEQVREATAATRLALGIPRFTGSADGGSGKTNTVTASTGPDGWGTLLQT